MADFYNMLGVTTTSSIREICKAYKSVIKWMPDKNNPQSQAKIAAINDAYTRAISGKFEEEEPLNISEPTIVVNFDRRKSIDDLFLPPTESRSFSRNTSRRCKTPTPTSFLRDRSRRSRGSGEIGRSSGELGRNSGEIGREEGFSRARNRRCTSETHVDMSSASLARNSGRQSPTPIIFSQSTARRKPSPVERKLECTLEELLEGCTKNIKITRDALSETGIIVQEEEILSVNVKPGWKKGTKIIFEGKGDEKPGYLPADLILLIEEKRHPLYEREGDNLEVAVEIPLVNALTGCSIPIPLLGGDKMTLSFDDVIYPGYEKVIKGQGMPYPKDRSRRGDLRIRFLVEFPVDLTDEQRAEAVAFLRDCS